MAVDLVFRKRSSNYFLDKHDSQTLSYTWMLRGKPPGSWRHVSMRVRRLMPALQRENDMGGRFTKRPPICRVPFGLGLPGKTGNARSEISEADGSDPLFEALVRAWGGFSQTRHRPLGVAPVRIDPCRKAVEPMSRHLSIILAGTPTAARYYKERQAHPKASAKRPRA